MISVIIPVKDGGDDLARCLDAISRQQTGEEVEVIVADTGSRDGSPALARSRGARVLELASSGFRHGATRNRAAEQALGDVLVFTVQDAYAANDRWLEKLCVTVRAEGVAGAYGRQIPHEDARAPERFFLDFLYGPEERWQRIASGESLSMRNTLFSNVNSAIPKSMWQKYPFDDDLFFSEDQDWSRRVLLAGYAVRYHPDAAVRHSHPYSLASAFKRFFDSGAAARRGYLAGGRESFRVLRQEGLRYVRQELIWLARTGQARSIPYTLVYELAKFLGLQVGARERLLPLWLKRRCSFFPGYWDEVARAGPER
jgi:glycosyltransferase involved in cell wall biosynthesis